MTKLILIAMLFAFTAMGSETSVIPRPNVVVKGDGVFKLNEKTVIVAKGKEAKAVATYLREQLSASTGLPLESARKAKSNCIILTTENAPAELGDEGYTFKSTKDKIVITAPKAAGLFYGVQTLRQLLPAEIYSASTTRLEWAIASVEIEDKPSYSWRGMMLDVSRYFYDSEFVKRYLDLMAMHKLNVLHLHLVDDAGWRIQIDKYPKLTEIGGYRDKGAKRYGGYYTKEEMRGIIDYAQRLHIDIVPEIELPAHIHSALAAYPWLGCTQKQLEVPNGYWTSKEILCAGRETTYKFLEDVMTEVVELFPFEYIHIGGDEANHERWKECEHCKAMLEKHGLKNAKELQGHMTRRIEKFLLAKNRRMIGWDEITNFGLSTNSAIMAWNNPQSAVQAAQEGVSVVMALTGHAYFDMPESKLPGEPPAADWLGPISLQKAYSWEPAPKQISEEQKKYILGAQACLWSDRFMAHQILQDISALNEKRSWRYAEYLSLPRMAALAEVTWTPQVNRSWEDFTKRMEQQYPRYSNSGYNFRVPLPVADKLVKTDKGYEVTMQCPVEGGHIRYTTDGTYPNIKSHLYSKPISIKDPEKFLAVTFVNPRHYSLAYAIRAEVAKLGADTRLIGMPNVERIDTSLPGENIEYVFDGLMETFFHAGRGPKAGDHLTMILKKAEKIKRLNFITGNSKYDKDWVRKGVVEVSADGEVFKEVAVFDEEADSYHGGHNAAAELTEPVKAVRLRILKDQPNWIVIPEIIFE